MRCIECSGQFVTIKGNLSIRDKILGNFTVPDTEYEECENCGEKLYSPITMQAIENAENLRKNKLLLKKPLEEFILAAEVAHILGCRRQAIHKNKKIRRGFIHFLKHNGRLYYLKESVELYKKTKDGRIPLGTFENKIVDSFCVLNCPFDEEKISSSNTGERIPEQSTVQPQPILTTASYNTIEPAWQRLAGKSRKDQFITENNGW